jgi:hypothetical protein
VLKFPVATDLHSLAHQSFGRERGLEDVCARCRRLARWVSGRLTYGRHSGLRRVIPLSFSRTPRSAEGMRRD